MIMSFISACKSDWEFSWCVFNGKIEIEFGRQNQSDAMVFKGTSFHIFLIFKCFHAPKIWQISLCNSILVPYFTYPKKEVPLLISSFFIYFIDQSKTANYRGSHFGLGYQKLSMESEGDLPGIGTFSLIYWNHFLKPGLIMYHMRTLS